MIYGYEHIVYVRVWGMKCPNCGTIDMIDYGNTKECPRCHAFVYPGYEPKKIIADADYGLDF